MEAGPLPSSVPNIFVVDDDEAVRSAVRLLVRSFGWQAQAFGSARELLAELDESEPDCVLMDLNMPEMNGAELQEALAERGNRVPVVVITAARESSLLDRVRAAGARQVLRKPFGDVELKACLELVLHG